MIDCHGDFENAIKGMLDLFMLLQCLGNLVLPCPFVVPQTMR